MCGIIGRVGSDDGLDELITGLENLEYRGYDSAGIAIQNGHGFDIEKREGEVDELKQAIDGDRLTGEIGIGHTRWSTHGPPSDTNAHPHTDCTDSIAVVHNGIIDNYESLKSGLEERGHAFESETDSEVIPHLIREHLSEASGPADAFRRTIEDLSGSYAIAVLIENQETIFVTREGSPVVLGLGDEEYFVASDVPAFLEYTDQIVYLEDCDIAEIDPSGVRVYDQEGNDVNRDIETISWDHDDVGKGGYDHFMLKEIHEQPNALRQTARGRIKTHDADISISNFSPGSFSDVEEVQFVGCGTSYHAAMYASRFLSDNDIRSQAFLAGEYASNPPAIQSDTLVVAVTQSGETADTLQAIQRATANGAATLAVTNTRGSTVTRECDDVIFIRAGPEIGVAATKTFSSQVLSLSILGERLTRDIRGQRTSDARERLRDLARLPGHVQEVIDESRAASIAERFHGSDAYFFIGRGFGYPAAREGALKFKEISYEHAEGFSASELKHGPLALIHSQTPVFAVFTGRGDEQTLDNIKEIQSREAPVIAIAGSRNSTVERFSDEMLTIPDTHHHAAGILANVQLQLIAYHAARLLNRSIDKPRNLAKSVTVT